MILYKYLPFAAGERLVRDNTLGFSQPEYFNDPFDTPEYPREVSSSPVESIFDDVRALGKRQLWKQNTSILSLTRTPTNPLMWAHYADGHRGVVVGIDVELAGLTDQAKNLIPAQFGNVVYVSQRSSAPFVNKTDTALLVGQTHHFPADHFEKLQRVFLHKSIHWFYEEEVRVLKCINGLGADGGTNPSGTFEIATVGDPSRSLYLLSVPPASIKEVYFGIRHDHEAGERMYAALQARGDVRVFECVLHGDALSVDFEPFVPLAERMQA